MRSVKTMYHSLDKLKADIVQKFVEKVSKSMEKINKLEWTISLQQTAIDDLKIKCGGNKQYSVCVCVITSIHREGFICLGLGVQGTDQRCCVEDLIFLYQVPSSILQYESPIFLTSRFILFAH